MNKKLLDIKNIYLSYDRGKTHILRDMSFTVSQGDTLSIIGKNGMGKSSLLKAIAGIESPQSGSITRYTSRISYVPQKLQLDKSFPLSVGEFFRIFQSSYTDDYLSELLKIFEIQKLITQNIHTLSGGEFQKVLIVNALLSKPELLLLDEPTTGIDVIGEELFYKNISLLRKSFPELAIILVSHNLKLVYKNSTRVICLHENNFCCHGTPSELAENPQIAKIFGEYLRPYKHQPHSHHEH